MKNFLIKNWKTTSAGILSIAGGIYTYYNDRTKVMEALTCVLTGIGLIMAKDADKTGDTSI
jgi:hypothetical protein